MMTRKQPGESNYSPGDINYSPYSREYGSKYRSDRFKDISGTRNGLTYFIYNPWFEPVFHRRDSRITDVSGGVSFIYSYKHNGAGPYWFGNNSVRGVPSPRRWRNSWKRRNSPRRSQPKHYGSERTAGGEQT